MKKIKISGEGGDRPPPADPRPFGVPSVTPPLPIFPPVRQYADICLFNTAQYKCPVAVEDAE